jgi:hypothetical protein
MLDIQSVHLFAGVFILVVLTILLIFDPLGFRWPKAPRPNDRRHDPHYAHLLRKTRF